MSSSICAQRLEYTPGKQCINQSGYLQPITNANTIGYVAQCYNLFHFTMVYNCPILSAKKRYGSDVILLMDCFAGELHTTQKSMRRLRTECAQNAIRYGPISHQRRKPRERLFFLLLAHLTLEGTRGGAKTLAPLPHWTKYPFLKILLCVFLSQCTVVHVDA